MFLKDEELTRGLIEGAQTANYGNISCDLLIREIISSSGRCTNYELKPRESVFVSTVEIIDVPPNMFAQIVIRNSAIRMGLDIAAPIYQPGHKTRIFFRVTNISSVTVNLKQNQSVCSLMFYQFASNSVKPYTGVYSEEFDYRGVGDFHSIATPTIGRLRKS